MGRLGGVLAVGGNAFLRAAAVLEEGVFLGLLGAGGLVAALIEVPRCEATLFNGSGAITRARTPARAFAGLVVFNWVLVLDFVAAAAAAAAAASASASASASAVAVAVDLEMDANRVFNVID